MVMGNSAGQVHVSLSKKEIMRLQAAGEDMILKHKRKEGGLEGEQTT